MSTLYCGNSQQSEYLKDFYDKEHRTYARHALKRPYSQRSLREPMVTTPTTRFDMGNFHAYPVLHDHSAPSRIPLDATQFNYCHSCEISGLPSSHGHVHYYRGHPYCCNGHPFCCHGHPGTLPSPRPL
uniref:Uncharacterized protein n=1 Tax=Cyanoptyche gloeocystis TaxID=77922 RepID=A0A7S2JL35_9EUKA